MLEKLESLYIVLSQVLPNKVFYGINIYDNLKTASTPFIVYQEISKRNKIYSDDKSQIKESTVQITLVTDKKDIKLEKVLENTLEINNLDYIMISEFFNDDKSVNRIYEIKMEEIKWVIK